jgi:hypothetical protein
MNIWRLRKTYHEITKQQQQSQNIKNKLKILQKKMKVFLSVLQSLYQYIMIGTVLRLPNDTPQQLKRKLKSTQSLLYPFDQSVALGEKTRSIQHIAFQFYNDITQSLTRLEQQQKQQKQQKQQQAIGPPRLLTRSSATRSIVR